MNSATPARIRSSLVLSALLGSMILTSCSATDQAAGPTANRAAPEAASDSSTNSAGGAAPTEPVAVAQVPRSRPQLIKHAELSLTVNSVEKSTQAASLTIKNQQGDLLELQDQRPSDDSVRHTVAMQIRVPQDRLELTLDALAKLGTVQNRTLTAEDVTDQLVDSEARLRNLRKTETTLLGIMERSGSVADVLKVAQELSEVRQSIEQNAAQLNNLRNRVAYSTISLSLEEAVATTSPQQPLGLAVQEAWNQSTHSVSELTANLIVLGVWLLAYTPYLLLLGVGAMLARKHFRQRQRLPQSSRAATGANAEPTHPGD